MEDSIDGIKVTFIRHAESFNNVIYTSIWNEMEKCGKNGMSEMEAYDLVMKEASRKRLSDCPLSEKGFKQALRLRDFYADELSGKKVLFVCSPMKRACQSLTPLAKACGATPESFLVFSHLYEHKGCFYMGKALPGSTKKELEAEFPVTAHGMDNGWFQHHKTPETPEQLFTRVRYTKTWLENIILPSVMNQFDEVILLAHGTLLHELYKEIMGSHSTQPIFCTSNTGVTEYFFDNEGHWCLKKFNDTTHLSPQLQTGGEPILDGWVSEISHVDERKMNCKL